MLDPDQYNHQILFALLSKIILNPVILNHLFSATMLGQDTIISCPDDYSGFLSDLGTSALASG